ncbi:hypothetical protein BX659_13527 [Orenia metallireducens]|jgi:hypothetical protein|uniref:Uncharacterized protein n=1 Tax=Orenia metallireducens TaxID=1413210 RepID=A0A285IB83_9FIRM|nr:hypothetical protein [Orenia metallireducens]PRX20627.1 hypothetical protein BX659_13527 [Orenia metallireducens]SNY45254.1 hypothetical protein SAMN06265827_13728 [Orenia metallireducens]
MGIINIIITTIIASLAVVFTLKADNWGARIVIAVVVGLLGAILNIAAKQIIGEVWGTAGLVGRDLSKFFISIPVIVAFVVGLILLYLSKNK